MHRTAHQLGMRTTATMMFGCGETIEQRMNHLELVRNIQEETGGFTAFIPWTFQRENTSLGRFVKEEATAVEYLQTLAISRIYLDNIENIQSVLGHAGTEDLPARPPLRRQRRRQHHDRGERRLAPPAPITAPAKRNSAASSATPASSPSSATRCTAPTS